MTAPSDNNGDDEERTQIGTPLPPPQPKPDEGQASAPPVQQPPVGGAPIQQPNLSQPPYGAGVQQPPYGQPPAQEDQASGWTMFGAPLQDPTQQAAPTPPPQPSQPPLQQPDQIFSTPQIDHGFEQPDAAAAADHVPGPGEPGWVPGGAPDPAPADQGGQDVGDGGLGWEADEPSPAPVADHVPGPGEPGWVPGGAPAEPVAEAAPDHVPGPGEPGWVPGGAPDAAPEDQVVSQAPAHVPGPGEPGWVPGGAAPEEPAPLSQPPVSDPGYAAHPPAQSVPPLTDPAATAAPQPDPTAAPAQGVAPEMQAAPVPPPVTATEQPAESAPPQTRRPRRGDGPTLEIGTVINNNYRIDQVLKAGGMGEVYRGAEVGTGDPVAIKVILPELATDEKVGQMFKREARTLRQLQDEAIVRYYNYVHDPDLDAYCLVMAFISGVPLSDHTAEHGPISIEDGKILIRRLAKGLEKAHELDVVHRDLSPDNVMLPHDKVAEAVLIDFGIAKSNVEKEQTLAGQFAGKFRYVSPEQLGHFGGEIGPQSDIYSLALLMAAALIGKPLEMGASIVEAVQSRQAIPDLSEVPQDLRPIMMHMLEPDPANRPQKMGDIVNLMDFPEQIPLNYRQGLPLPNTAMPQTTRGATTGMPYRPPTNQVSGLQLAPTTATTSGTAEQSDVPNRRRTGGGLGIALILALAVLGGGGYYGFSQGWFDAPEPVEEPTADLGEAPTRLENTREGFLATFNSGGCTYASRLSGGSNDGSIGAMSTTSGAFASLPAAFAERFNDRPAIVEQPVTESQCAALSLARSLQGTNLEPVSVALSTTTQANGTVIDGTLTDADNRAIWLVLITANGQIFNLTNRLSDPVGVERTFTFNLNPIAAGSDGVPNLLMAIATDEALVRAGVARDRTPASDLLPLVQREIESRNGRAAAALNHILLTPFVPEAPEPPAPTEEEETAPETDE